jgi:hypothetical protein
VNDGGAIFWGKGEAVGGHSLSMGILGDRQVEVSGGQDRGGAAGEGVYGHKSPGLGLRVEHLSSKQKALS